MEKLLSTIIIILLTFYILKYIFRLLMPFFVSRFFGRVQKKYEEQSGYYQADNERREEGDVKVQSRVKRSEEPIREKLDEGEYVDFEEIK